MQTLRGSGERGSFLEKRANKHHRLRFLLPDNYLNVAFFQAVAPAAMSNEKGCPCHRYCADEPLQRRVVAQGTAMFD